MNPSLTHHVRLFLLFSGVTVILLPCRRAHAGELATGKITISWETTRVTGPVDEAGFVVYSGAVNARNASGVTPENNAAVLAWRAFGPSEIPAGERERFWRLIGINPLPDEGNYFQIFPADLGQPGVMSSDEFLRQLDATYVMPWSEADYPKVVEWLKANEKPLELIAAASLKPRYFSPRWAERAADGHEQVIMMMLPDSQTMRQVAKALAVRAMLHLQHGRTDDCHRDLMVCFRMGRLVGQGAFLIEQLVGIAINGIACAAEQTLAQQGKLTTDQARRFERDIRELPPIPHIADAIDSGERFGMLDAITASARHGFSLKNLDAGNLKMSGVSEQILEMVGERLVDWDEVLRYANGWYDRAVETARVPAQSARAMAAKSFGEEIVAMKNELQPGNLLGDDTVDEAMTRVVGQTFVVMLFPAITQMMTAHDRAQVRIDETRIALGLAGFLHEHGRYPAQLSEIAERFGEIPEDLYSGQDLIYRPLGSRYVLYSVGENGRDDNGASFDSNPAGDDIRVYDFGEKPKPNVAEAANPPSPPRPNEYLPRPTPPTFSTSTIVLMCLAGVLTLGLIAWLIDNALKRQRLQKDKENR